MRSLDFSIYLIIPADHSPGVYSACNRTEHQKIFWGQPWPARKAHCYRHLWADCLDNVKSSISLNITELYGDIGIILYNCQRTRKNAVFWDVTPCSFCKKWHFGGAYCLHLQRTRNCEVGITSAVNSNRCTLRRNALLVTANVQARRFLLPWWWKWYVPPKCRFLQRLHGVTSQNTTFFIVTAVKTSTLT
jgi:hypothetical protein